MSDARRQGETSEVYKHTPQRGATAANTAGDTLMADRGAKGFVIGATGSGAGKTTITLAILAWLKQNGYTTAPFKVGPDFIDPGHHTAVAGRTCYNLDSWMLSKEYNQRLFMEKSQGADIAVVEGVMGLFDGFDGVSDAGSTAQMAKWLKLPVLLVVSAKGAARSAAAVVKGFETFDPDLTLAGVIFSKTGSERHYQYLKEAVDRYCDTPCLGHLPRNDALVMPERHLGLVTADEARIDQTAQSELIGMVEDHMNLSKWIQPLDPVTQTVAHDPESPNRSADTQLYPEEPVIAVARDKAFCFYYPDNLEMLEQNGASLTFFSPLEDSELPPGTDGIYLGGGYPELFADQLTQNKELMARIKACSRSGMPIYAECGGFMFLCQTLSCDNKRYPMCGCFDLDVMMSNRLRSLGYREITLTRDTIIGRKNDLLRGHEFHYSSLKTPGSEESGIYQVTSRSGQDIDLKGYMTHNTLGSYLHLHFGSNPGMARQLVSTCRAYKESKSGHGSQEA